MTNLQIAQIELDEEIQSRARLDLFTIAEYAEAMRAGAEFPPVVVFSDGAKFWLADGFHRVKAALQAGLQTINTDFRQGGRRAAILFSVGSNATHGLKRSNEDKRRAVMTLLADKEWTQWSDSEIARQTKTSHTYVGKLRGHLATFQDGPRLVRRGDSVYQMDTANIGQGEALSEAEQNRLATLESQIDTNLETLKRASTHLLAIMLKALPELIPLQEKEPETLEECMYYIETASFWQNELAEARLRTMAQVGGLLKD